MDKKINREKELEAVLTICVGLLIIFYCSHSAYLLVVAIAIGLLGLFIKPAGHLIAKCWLLLGEAMGAVTSRVILGAVFFIVLVPIALFSRLFSRNVMQVKKGQGPSYFRDRNHAYTAGDLKNTW
jgi:hypothetical protein